MTLIDVLCSNFVKFVRQEIGKVVRYLPDKKKQNFLQLWLLRYYRAQNLPDNVLRVLQISSKSVHFRRSYVRTREHRQSTLEIESNIRLKLSFEPNSYHVNVLERSRGGPIIGPGRSGGVCTLFCCRQAV